MLAASLAAACFPAASEAAGTRVVDATRAPRLSKQLMPLGNSGDFNGDGRGDALLTRHRWLTVGLAAGSAAAPRLRAGISVKAPAHPNYQAPIESGMVGDVNGDGRDDLGAYLPRDSRLGRKEAGALAVVFGTDNAARLDPNAALGPRGFFVYGAAPDSHLGESRAPLPVGDVNGDGVGDMLVNEGVTWWVVLGASISSDIDLATPGERAFPIRSPAQRVPDVIETAAGVGDVNGDGRDDLGFGLPEVNKDRGEALIVYGRSDPVPVDLAKPLGSAGVRIVGSHSGLGCCDYPGNAGDDMGALVSAAGDVDHDGFDDVAIAASGLDSLGRRDAGAIMVMHGGRSLRDTNGDALMRIATVITGRKREQNLGLQTTTPDTRFVHDAGDQNGDGVPDLLVVSQDDTAGDGFGAEAYVVYASRRRTSLDLAHLGRAGFRIAGARVKPGAVADLQSVATPGDVDGDGRPDLLVATLSAGVTLLSGRTGTTTP